MASLTQLKKEIQFQARLNGLLDVLKSIAAQQFQILEKSYTTNPVFFETAEAIAGTFNLESFPHPLTRGQGPVGVIAVTSDAGLLGGLNQQVITTALKECRANPGELIVIGKRGLAYLQGQKISVKEFPGVQDETKRRMAEQVRDYALNQVLQGRLGKLFVVYAKALSFTLQKVETIPVVPCQGWQRSERVSAGVRSGKALLLESPTSRLIEYLVWAWLEQKLVDVFGSSRLAELAARSVHLEGSCQELQRRKKKLMQRYFRERREIIDRGMRELFAAKSVYGKT